MPLLAGHAFGCHWNSSLCVPAAVSRSRAKWPPSSPGTLTDA
jgi:hypothetical protein